MPREDVYIPQFEPAATDYNKDNIDRNFNEVRDTVERLRNSTSSDIDQSDADLTALEGTVTSISEAVYSPTTGLAETRARIITEEGVRATADTALAARSTTLEATVNDGTTGLVATRARLITEESTRATADTALAARSTTLEATVNDGTTGLVATRARLITEESTRASADSALATRSTNLEATVNNATTGVAATAARLTTEETTRATADTALATRSTNLEATVNDGTTGVAATAARLTTEETTRASADTALAARATTLEATVNDGTTGLVATRARLITEESTRASADSALATRATTLEARSYVKGNQVRGSRPNLDSANPNNLFARFGWQNQGLWNVNYSNFVDGPFLSQSLTSQTNYNWFALNANAVPVSSGIAMSAQAMLGKFGTWTAGTIGIVIYWYSDPEGTTLVSGATNGVVQNWEDGLVIQGQNANARWVRTPNQIAPTGAQSCRLGVYTANATGNGVYTEAGAWMLKLEYGSTCTAWTDEAMPLEIDARVRTEESARASADSALATRATTLEATVNNGTTGVAATAARLTTEETTRATADSALATRATNLESTVNNATTGVAATAARLTVEESARASADAALASRSTTLEARVNADQQADYLSNGQFLRGTNGWVQLGGGGTVTTVTPEGISGRNGIHITAASGAGVQYYGTEFAVPTWRTLDLAWTGITTLWSGGTNTGASVQVHIQGKVGAGSYSTIASTPAFTDVDQLVTPKTLRATTGAGYDTIRLLFAIAPPSSGSTLGFILTQRVSNWAGEFPSLDAGPRAVLGTEARVATEETARASADSALATRSTTLESVVRFAAPEALNKNPTFATWSGTLPEDWSDWSFGTATITKTAGDLSPNACRQSNPAGVVNYGIYQPLNGRMTQGWHVLEAEVTLNSGALWGGSVHLNWGISAITHSETIHFAGDADITGSVVAAGTVGRRYRFSKLVNIAVVPNLCNVFLMTNWEGTATTGNAKDLTWHKCLVRPATQGEIDAKVAKDVTIPATIARITFEEITRSDADDALALRSTNLESTVNHGTTGVAATAARLTVEEGTRADADEALAGRATTLEARSYVKANQVRGSRPNLDSANPNNLFVRFGWQNQGLWNVNYSPYVDGPYLSQDLKAQTGYNWYALNTNAIPVVAGTALSAQVMLGKFGTWNAGTIGIVIYWYSDTTGTTLNSGATNSITQNWEDGLVVPNQSYGGAARLCQVQNQTVPTGAQSARIGIFTAGATGNGIYTEAGAWKLKLEYGSTCTAWTDEAMPLEIDARVRTEESARASADSALATRSTVLEAVARTRGDSVLPDPDMRDTAWWTAGVSGVGLGDTLGDWRRNRYIVFGINGSFDFSTPYFPVQIGATYRVRVRIWNNAGGWTGAFWPLIHMPNAAWYSLKHGSAVNPDVADAANAIVAGGDTGELEWTVTNTAASGNANRNWQFRFKGLNLTAASSAAVSVEIVQLTGWSELQTTVARIATEETTRATADSALASRSTTLEAVVRYPIPEALNKNPTFSTWSGASGTLPEDWSNWSNGFTNTKETGDISPFAYRQAKTAGISANWGLFQNIHGVLTQGWYVLEADIRLNSGTLNGAGAYIQYGVSGITDSVSFGFWFEPDVNGTVHGAGTAGRRYRWAKLVQLINTANLAQIYAMTSWDGFGETASSNLKDITWHKCSVRPASDSEIELRAARNGAASVGARITTEESARASGDSANASLITTLTARSYVKGNLIKGSRPNYEPASPNGLFSRFGWLYQGLWNVAYSVYVDGPYLSQGLTSQTNYNWVGLATNAMPIATGLPVSVQAMLGKFGTWVTGTLQIQIYWYTDTAGTTGITAGPSKSWESGVVVAGQNSGGRWVDIANAVAPSGVQSFRLGINTINATGNGSYTEGGAWMLKAEYGSTCTAWTDEALASENDARVTINSGAIATLNSSAAFWQVLVAASGGDPAIVRLFSGLGGSEISLAAKVLSLINTSSGVAMPVMRATGGEAFFQRPISSDFGSRRVTIGPGYGVSGSEVVLWFGPSTIAPASQSRTNCIFALGTDGIVYYGGLGLAVGGMQGTLNLYDVNLTRSGAGATVQSMTATGYAPGTITYLWELISGDAVNIGSATSATTNIGHSLSIGETKTSVVRCTMTSSAGPVTFRLLNISSSEIS